MSELSFTWNGVSSDAHGVVVTRLPPVMIAGKRDEKVVVPGRSGALHLQDGAWDEMLLSIECYLPYEQGVTVSTPAVLAAWLQGTAWLTLSNRPDVRFYARLTDAVTLSPLMEGFEDRIFALSFWADPFAYEETPTVETHTAAFTLTNSGSVFAEPVIELTANGDLSLTIGGRTIDLTGVPAEIDALPGPIVIDVPAGLIYKGENNLSGYASTDDWPLIIPTGDSAVSWTGSVSQLKIAPNWRWL